MDDWENFNETLFPEKDFYSHLKMEDITDAKLKRTEKEFAKKLRKYHDLFV